MVSLLIRYVHLAALMIGGGTALAIDRVVLGTARHATDDRRRAAFTAMQGFASRGRAVAGDRDARAAS